MQKYGDIDREAFKINANTLSLLLVREKADMIKCKKDSFFYLSDAKI